MLKKKHASTFQSKCGKCNINLSVAGKEKSGQFNLREQAKYFLFDLEIVFNKKLSSL